MTATSGLVLLVLLPIEGLTLLSLHSLLSVHMLVGFALIPPVALKLGSVSYRFFRYYARSPAYVCKGPPLPALRVLAPPLLAATLAVMGSGFALLVTGPIQAAVFVHGISVGLDFRY